MVGEYYGGGDSGFISDSDGASANLNINMSEESARNLWDVQAALQQIAADIQTAVRGTADFQSYLISIREIGQTLKLPDGLGIGGGEGGNVTYSGRVDSQSVPIVQSEIGMAGRIAEMQANSTGAAEGGALASRAPHSADIGQAINQAIWMAGMAGQGGHRQHPDGGFGGRGDLIEPHEGLAAAGGGGGGMVYGAARYLTQGIGAGQQFLGGGGLGGVAGMIGRLGAYGAIGYAGYQLVDAGIQTYAQSRAAAIASNNSQHGTGWGFGTRIDQSVMAMTPYVTGEEAAQIYDAAIQQGWASRNDMYGGHFGQGNFNNAVNFMYTAAKDYNMDPAQAAQLLQTNSLGAGQSIAALAEQLYTLKETLDGTGVSMDVASSSFESFTSMLIGMGANPDTAATIAGGALRGYALNTYLGPSGRGAQIAQETIGQTQAQNVLAGLTGTIPGASFSGSHGMASTEQLQKLTARFAQQVLSMSGTDMDEKAAMFVQLYNGTFGTSITQQDALNMIAENAANPNVLTGGQQQYLESGKISALQHQSSLRSWWAGLDSNRVGGVAYDGPESGRADYDYNQSVKDINMVNAYNNYVPEVNKLLENSADLTKVVLYGPDGKPILDSDGRVVAGANIAKWFNDEANYNKFSASNSGYYIQDSTGAKFNSNNIGLGGVDAKALVNESDKESRTVYITLSPQAKAWFDTDKSKLDLSSGKTES